MASPELSYCAGLVRQHDPDVFLCLLFAPAEKREALFVLRAFGLETGKIRNTVSEPHLGRIKLQWWRERFEEIYNGDAVFGGRGLHADLADTIRTFDLPRGPLEAHINAREFDMEDNAPDDLKALERYLEATWGGLGMLAGKVLTGGENRAVGDVWRAMGLLNVIKTLPFQARSRRSMVPIALMRQLNMDKAAFLNLKPCGQFPEVVAFLCDQVRVSITEARSRKTGKDVLPALLPAILMDAELKALKKAGYNPFDPASTAGKLSKQLKLGWAALRNRY